MSRDAMTKVLIVGAGSGQSASRNAVKLPALVAETGAPALGGDAAEPDQVAAPFDATDARTGVSNVVIHDPGVRARDPIATLDPAEGARRLSATASTGASASIKKSASFATGRFALLGLAQGRTREPDPQGLRVAHVPVDGGTCSAANPGPPDGPDSRLGPHAIARAHPHLLRQPRSAWSHEIDLRPWTERF